MKTKFLFLVLLASVVLLTFALGAAPAGAATGGLPGVGTPGVAYLHLIDGDWWLGGSGWGGSTQYPPGTPIPAQDFITAYDGAYNPDRSLLERFPQIFLLSLTVKAANGEIVVKITEEQAARFWGSISWDPFFDIGAMWVRYWQVPLGHLAPGTYRVTWVVHQTTALEFTVTDENGNPVTVVLPPSKDTYKPSFTVQ